MPHAPTLVSAFAPRIDGDWRGVAAAMCALTADAEVMARILTCFTGEVDAQRARRGAATALLALDRRSDRAKIRTVPGLVLAEPSLKSWRDGSMLHAKVALLGYARDANSPIRRLRLIVNTGNWTVASLNDQIEMLWMDEMNLESVKNRDPLQADMNAAGSFFNALLFPSREATALFQSVPPVPRISELLECASGLRRSARPRFVHSLSEALLPQIARRFQPAKQAWNWIYVGSGFFEQGTGKPPKVLTKIVTSLGNNLTKTSSKTVVLNPAMPGALAEGRLDDWVFCKPEDEHNRYLHAKFIAVARKHSERFLDLAVYLGSGNLTIPGLVLPFNHSSGETRIEAGVVFKEGDVDDVFTVLPRCVEIDEVLVAQGAGDDEAAPPVPPPPILFGQVVAATSSGSSSTVLLFKSDPESAAEVRVDGALIDVPIGKTDVDLVDVRMAYLEVRDKLGSAWQIVPVFGANGEFARQPLTPGSIEDALDLLIAYPGIPDGDEDELDGLYEASGGANRSSRSNAKPGRYPARDAMRIVEGVARLVALVDGDDMVQMRATMRTIEWALVEAVERSEKKRIAEVIGIDFFAALTDMPDMPKSLGWAALVAKISEDWGLDGFSSLRRRRETQGLS